jgi:hypothetical protein
MQKQIKEEACKDEGTESSKQNGEDNPRPSRFRKAPDFLDSL